MVRRLRITGRALGPDEISPSPAELETLPIPAILTLEEAILALTGDVEDLVVLPT